MPARRKPLVFTDTVRIAELMPPKMTVLSVADVLAETIRNVIANRSIAAQFGGLELF